MADESMNEMFGFTDESDDENVNTGSLYTRYDRVEGESFIESLLHNYEQETPLRALNGRGKNKTLAHEYGRVKGHWKQRKNGNSVAFSRRIPLFPNLYRSMEQMEVFVAALDPAACKKEGTLENTYARMLADAKKDEMSLTPFSVKTNTYVAKRDLVGVSKLAFPIPVPAKKE